RQKAIAYLVFADYLPMKVWDRRSKLDLIGNKYRDWLRYGAERVGLVDRMQSYLNLLGLPAKTILSRVKDMAAGRQSSDWVLNAIVAYLFWLDRYLHRHIHTHSSL